MRACLEVDAPVPSVHRISRGESEYVNEPTGQNKPPHRRCLHRYAGGCDCISCEDHPLNCERLSSPGRSHVQTWRKESREEVEVEDDNGEDEGKKKDKGKVRKERNDRVEQALWSVVELLGGIRTELQGVQEEGRLL